MTTNRTRRRRWPRRTSPPGLGFAIVYPAQWQGRPETDIYSVFPYVRGMATLALTEAGWEVEGTTIGSMWAHWRKDEKLIYVRGFGPLAERRIPFQGQGGVSQEELDALADRLVGATGWEVEPLPPVQSTSSRRLGRILGGLKQLRLPTFDRGDRGSDLNPSVENPDSLAASGGRGAQDSSNVAVHAGYPPGYVPPVDEGRPRH